MKCYAPLEIRNPKPLGSQFIEVPCGKCGSCLQKKRADWTIRLLEEAKQSLSAHFVTLTYNQNQVMDYVEDVHNENSVPSVHKYHIQNFFKALRPLCKNKIRYYVVAEYGPTSGRPHYHAIIFNLGSTQDAENMITKAWKWGFHHIGKVTQASIHYVTKYHLTKNFVPLDANPVFALMSRRGGLGSNYLESKKEYHEVTENIDYTFSGGIKQRLPRFYQSKIFDKNKLQEIQSRYKDEKEHPFAETTMQRHYEEYDCNYFEDAVQRVKEFHRKSEDKLKANFKL